MMRRQLIFFLMLWSFFFLFFGSGVAVAQDLQVTQLTTNTVTPKIGQQLTTKITVENKSSTAAAKSVLRLYYSQNSQISTNDPKWLDVNIPALSANGKYSTQVVVVVPAYYGTGQRWMGAIVDYNNRVRESNNSNNSRRLALTVAAGPSPDLFVSALTLSKTTVSSGEKITANFTVNNIGSKDSTETVAAFLLSTNTNITTFDPQVLSVKLPVIKAGASYKGTATLTIPGGSGVRYLGLFADPQGTTSGATPFPGKVSESNENNNTRYVRVVIRASDLVVQNMTVTPLAFKANDKITVSAEVFNQGQVDAAATTLGVYFSTNSTLGSTDKKVGTVSVNTIKAGARLKVSATITVTATMMQGLTGAFYVLGQADDSKKVVESNETNNTAGVLVNINGVDLVVSKFEISPTPRVYAQNEEVLVTFRVRNNGNQTATSSVASIHYSTSSNFSINATRLGTVNVPSLGAGKESGDLTLKVRIPNAASFNTTRYLFAYADGLRRVREVSEVNNTRGQSFLVGAVNLRISAVTLSPTTGPRGTKVTVRFTVQNSGNKDAPVSTAGVYFSTNSTISTSDTRLVDVSIPKIAAGKDYKATASITVPNNANVGIVYFGAYADRTTQIGEQSELDNGRSAFFRVIGNIDLQPLKITPSTTTNLFPGSIIPTVDVSVKNNGRDTSGSYYVRLYWSQDATFDSTDLYMDQDIESALRGGATRTSRNSQSRIPAGAYGTGYIIAVVDPDGRVVESNEKNNTIAIKVTLRARRGPDLIPEKVEPSNLTPRPGTALSVKVTIKNIGDTTTGKAGAVSIYLSTDSFFSTTRDTFLATGTMPLLTKGASAAVTLSGRLPTNLTARQYWVFAYVDAQRGITEGNEYNNWKAATIRVTIPSENPSEPRPEPVVDAGPKPEPVVDAGPKPEPVVDAGPKPEPVVDAGPKPEPVVDAGPKPEPVVDAGPKPEPVVDAGPKPEPAIDKGPRPEKPASDQPNCPNGCPAGEICMNGQCVPIPVPDSDESNPEDAEGADSPEGDVDSGSLQDKEPDTNATDQANSTDQSSANDQSNSSDQSNPTEQTGTPDTGSSNDATSMTDSTTSKEGGNSGGTDNALPKPPEAGCACDVQFGVPLVPTLLMILFVVVATFRRKKQPTSLTER